MPVCPDCGVVTLETTRFCASCGRDNKPVMQYQTSTPYQREGTYSAPQSRGSGKSLDQMFGIDPRIAFLAFVVDLMLFGTAAA
ncbi:MAG: hypothetical protein JO051_08860, partial [Acidobacteriaceae bacterium]|nr:hypothetical protein [Acidobacteriaceae bacterium]